MPYGIPKEHDTPENNDKMERCVERVMEKGKPKESAIRICKVSLFGEVQNMDALEIMKVSEAIERISLAAEILNDVEPQAIGKVLSKANRNAVKNAIAALLDVMDRAGDDSEDMESSRVDIVMGESGIALEAGERFGAMIKRARTDKGLMMSEVCKQMTGSSVISEQCLMRYESGYTREMPPEDIVNALAGVLDLDARQLMRAAELDYSAPVSTY